MLRKLWLPLLLLRFRWRRRRKPATSHFIMDLRSRTCLRESECESGFRRRTRMNFRK